MRKKIFGRKFKRDTNERKALFRSLMHGLVLHGKIRTTEAKAKAIKGTIEKYVTMGRNKGEEARRDLMSHLANEKVVEKIIAEIAPKFANRPGGYTRILRMQPRVKDGASMVLMTWTETISVTPTTQPKREKTTVSSAKKSEKASNKPVRKQSKTAVAKKTK
ncbi:MAG TPA: 50S ribosomal protein L17 [Patescibacteria group bacterium]|nr:50S ribosomal protein L17 [Patescibacteria group bacterium]